MIVLEGSAEAEYLIERMDDKESGALFKEFEDSPNQLYIAASVPWNPKYESNIFLRFLGMVAKKASSK